MNEGAGPPKAPPTPPPAGKRGMPFGVQVGFGFFLPAVAALVYFVVIVLSSRMQGAWSSAGVFLGGVVGLLVFLGGVWLAVRRGWRGVLFGLLLCGAVVLLLIGACFLMVSKMFR